MALSEMSSRLNVLSRAVGGKVRLSNYSSVDPGELMKGFASECRR